MKPFGTRIKVLPDAALTENNGLILAQANKPVTGTITAIGDKVEVAKVGDKVVYSPYAGTEIEGQLFMHEKEIIACGQ